MISERTKKIIEDIKTGAIIVLLVILALGTSAEDIDEAKEIAYKRGYAEGIEEKQSYWYDMGYLEGRDEGASYGYDHGWELGYMEGYDDCLEEYGLAEHQGYQSQRKLG